jgi:uncharacterized protein DUF4331
MKPRQAIATATIAAGTALAALTSVHASDHLDGPRAVANPQADITDVFAFTSPETPGHVVLAMTVTPFAPPAAEFSTVVDYVFRVRRVLATQPLTFDTASLDITCDFAGGDGATQTVTCSGPPGIGATAPVGAVLGAEPQSALRVFAGRRADPAFFDRQGAIATVQSGRLSFTGQNAFAGADVLAIVVELDAAALGDAGAPLPMLGIAAETVQRGAE